VIDDEFLRVVRKRLGPVGDVVEHFVVAFDAESKDLTKCCSTAINLEGAADKQVL
jgi:hypothetical protein